MGIFDGMQDNAQDNTNDTDMRDKIQNYADEHGISFDEAKASIMNQRE